MELRRRSMKHKGNESITDRNQGETRNFDTDQERHNQRSFWYASICYIWKKAKMLYRCIICVEEYRIGHEFVLVDPYFSIPVVPPNTVSVCHKV